MAIVSCPFCGKKVSNKAATCQHCGAGLTDVSPEQLMKVERDRRMAKAQSINNHAMIAIVVFLGSVLYLYYKEPLAETVQWYATYISLGAGALGYIISKVRMVMHKRQ
jgi:uncharacterized membrane protein YvbJ